jgi:hypothetical protein
MNEMLLHYFWRNQLFHALDLHTTDHRALKLVYPGNAHQNAGPDFKQAVIKIDGITWVGDVEIHVRTSDWLRHGHQHDAKYQSVILHVVYQHDVELEENFPTLELKEYIPPSMVAEYEQMSCSRDLLPCRQSLPEVTPLQFASWLSRLAVERMQRKQQEVVQVVRECHHNWQEAVFRCFVANFGFSTNASAFELLSKNLPYRYVLKHKDSRLQIYALVFGQAGLLEQLPDEPDSYFESLQSEYDYLKYKYGLTPIPAKIWNLLRLRPQNFPCVRLAQLSECLYRIPELMELLLNDADISLLRGVSLFEPSDYWKSHLHFGRDSPTRPRKIGQQTFNLLVINVVVPVRLAYAAFRGDDAGRDHTMALLETCDFESNHITRQYVSAGFPSGHALYSQAILELYKGYCTPKRCANCDIGCLILRKLA